LSRWIKIGIGLLVVAMAVSAVVIATHWPFTRGKVIQSLEQSFASTVEFQSFRVTYFRPGFVAEGVTFRRNADVNTPPIATVAKLVVQGSYSGFFMFPKRIPRVKVEGLHVFVSPQSERSEGQPTNSAEESKVNVAEIDADHAVLEFSSGDQPLRFEISKLTLNAVGEDHPMAFHVTLKNPEPPGEIRADGQFGPLRHDDTGQTAASGSYVFDRADLSVFPGIAGRLSSTGRFGGVLEQLEVAGETEVPDFEVTSAGHAVHLKAQFQAIVNGMNGDVALKSVSVQFGKTSVVAQGEVSSKAAADGKTVSLVGAQQQGTIQDWLQLLSKGHHPAMNGAMAFRAKVQVPPGKQSFLKRLNLQGDFTIGSADFVKPATQQAVNNLSQVALGQKQNDNPASVDESMKGHVVMTKAMATLTDLYFGVPGALAHMHGTYEVLTGKIDLHGNLRVDNKLSKGETGMKSALLKVAEPFLKKKKQGEIVPIKIDGTFSHPSYGLDIIK